MLPRCTQVDITNVHTALQGPLDHVSIDIRQSLEATDRSKPNRSPQPMQNNACISTQLGEPSSTCKLGESFSTPQTHEPAKQLGVRFSDKMLS